MEKCISEDTYKLVPKDFKEGEWPQSTEVACWWCCHRFEGAPIGAPLQTDGLKFFVEGVFCSYPCAKAYILDSPRSDRNTRCQLLTHMMQKVHGKFSSIPIAPPRSKLEMFGGNMAIQDFRSSAYLKTAQCHDPPFMAVFPTIEEQSVVPEATKKNTKENDDNVEFNLCRNTPLPNMKHSLDQFMNIDKKMDSQTST